MKFKSLLFIVALLAGTMFISCTPESIEDDQTEQQVDTQQIQAPRQG